ncbi:MAG: OmpH family outer membrane protein [Duncaniella sp.]|nr:OmpH family outer membrane protein [Duncaniella sp.]
MKKTAMSASALLLAAALFALPACSGSDTVAAGPSAAADSTGAAAGAATSLNIRYIDMDTLLSQYAYAKDYQEVVVRTDSRLQSAQQAKANEIQKFAQTMENKYKNNGYLSEASFAADQQKLQKMQQDAESTLATMARNAQIDLAQQQQALNDTIENFVKAYNAEKGYDAILFKAAGIYFNPALDITDEIVKGLNAKYNKVEPAK